MAKRKLKECHSCKAKVYALVTMKLSQLAYDLESNKVMDFYPLCVHCVEKQVKRWTDALAANGLAP